jgi:hypothetical protein
MEARRYDVVRMRSAHDAVVEWSYDDEDAAVSEARAMAERDDGAWIEVVDTASVPAQIIYSTREG